MEHPAEDSLHERRIGQLAFRWLGRIGYPQAYREQVACVDAALAARTSTPSGPAHQPGQPAPLGTVLLLEHDPVITVSRRPGAAANLLASPAMLAHAGVAVEETDRGGDITYHGPGQLVAYPIVDLNACGLRLHDYMRTLEEAVIATLGRFGIAGRRDPGATGVWVDRPATDSTPAAPAPPADAAKICAMGVRVRQWVSMHGLALNVSPNLAHFGLIVPCGLVGRPVTSMAQLLGPGTPTLGQVAEALSEELALRLTRRDDAQPEPG
ncbi:MAG: lipoyl(octanoyl) transferase LipB [Planctomycetaceae bacterium]|nr:lipoyl(octanoyl) transferase LipB [Planctomycetaceae bacterium]